MADRKWHAVPCGRVRTVAARTQRWGAEGWSCSTGAARCGGAVCREVGRELPDADLPCFRVVGKG